MRKSVAGCSSFRSDAPYRRESDILPEKLCERVSEPLCSVILEIYHLPQTNDIEQQLVLISNLLESVSNFK